MTAESDKTQRWKTTTKIAIVIIIADLGIFAAGVSLEDFPISLSVVGIGIITFFGMLSVAKYQSIGSQNEEKDTGHMRTALAGMLVCIYVVVVVLTMTGDFESNNANSANIVEHFSQVIMVVIIFYFGSKAAKEIAKAYSKSK